MQQLNRDPIGRFYEGHVAVAGWAVDGDALIHEGLAEIIYVVYAVGQMAGHLVAVADRIVGLVGGADLDAMALVRDGIAPEWESALTSSIQQVRAAWAPEEVLTQMMTTPWASLPGAVAASIYSAELLVHTWDLAASIGVGPEFNEADVADAVTTLRFGLPADGRGDDDMPFDPVVPTADDAPHIHQLVAWVGRQPTWTA